MILDDCLMPPLPRILSALDVDPIQQISPTKFFFYRQLIPCTHFPPLLSRISLVHLIVPPFSSQPSLQFDLLSCSSLLVSGTKLFLTRCHATLTCVVLHHMSLY